MGAGGSLKISKGDKMISIKNIFKSNYWNLYVRLWKSLCPYLIMRRLLIMEKVNKKNVLLIVLTCIIVSLEADYLTFSKFYFDVGSGITYGSRDVAGNYGLKFGLALKNDGKWFLNGETTVVYSDYQDSYTLLAFFAPNLMYYPISNLQLSLSTGSVTDLFRYNINNVHYHGNIPCGTIHSVSHHRIDFGLKVSMATDILKGEDYGLLLGLELLNVFKTDYYALGVFLKIRISNAKAVTNSKKTLKIHSFSTPSLPKPNEEVEVPHDSPSHELVWHQNMVAALNRASQKIMEGIDKNLNIAVVNVSSIDNELSEFVVEELEYILVSNQRSVVNRNELNRLRQEQALQLSGEFDDDTIVQLGKFAGTDIVITVSITGSGENRRLRFKAINIETAILMTVISEPF